MRWILLGIRGLVRSYVTLAIPSRFYWRHFKTIMKFWVSVTTANVWNSWCQLTTLITEPFRMSVTSRNPVDILRASFTVQREAGTRRPWPHDETGTLCCAGPYRFSSFSLILKFVIIWNSPVKSVELPHNVKVDIGNGFCTSISRCFSNFLVWQFLLNLGCFTAYWCEPCKQCVKLTLTVGAVLTLWGPADCLPWTSDHLIYGDYFHSQGAMI
jgi:hypothetical protein